MGRKAIEDWKLDRLLELGRRGNVYPDQIAERLGVSETYVIRTLRSEGIEPVFRPRFSYTKWLNDQYARDKREGRVTGRRPPTIRRS